MIVNDSLDLLSVEMQIDHFKLVEKSQKGKFFLLECVVSSVAWFDGFDLEKRLICFWNISIKWQYYGRREMPVRKCFSNPKMFFKSDITADLWPAGTNGGNVVWNVLLQMWGRIKRWWNILLAMWNERRKDARKEHFHPYGGP